MYPRVSDETDHPPSSFIEYLTVPNAIIIEYTQQSKKRSSRTQFERPRKHDFVWLVIWSFQFSNETKTTHKQLSFFLEKFEYYAQRQNVGKQDRKINTIHRQNERGKKKIQEEKNDEMIWITEKSADHESERRITLFYLFFFYFFICANMMPLSTRIAGGGASTRIQHIQHFLQIYIEREQRENGRYMSRLNACFSSWWGPNASVCIHTTINLSPVLLDDDEA